MIGIKPERGLTIYDAEGEEKFIQELRQRQGKKPLRKNNASQKANENKEEKAKKRANNNVNNGNQKKHESLFADLDSDNEDEKDEKKKNKIKGDDDAKGNGLFEDEDELISMLPWSYWVVNFDRLNPFSPVQVMNHYYTRHTTGPSIAYFFATIVILGIQLALILSRYNNYADSQMTIIKGTTEDSNEAVLPTFGFSFTGNAAAFPLFAAYPDNYFNFKFSRCESTIGSVDVSNKTCRDIGVRNCTVTGFANMRCPGTDDAAIIRGSLGTPTYSFVRFQLLPCTNNTLSSLANVTLGCLANGTTFANLVSGSTLTMALRTARDEKLNKDQAVVTNTSYRFFPLTNSALQNVVYYRYVTFRSEPQFFIDGEVASIAVFKQYDSIVRLRNAAIDPVYFDFRFVLDYSSDFIVLSSLTCWTCWPLWLVCLRYYGWRDVPFMSIIVGIG